MTAAKAHNYGKVLHFYSIGRQQCSPLLHLALIFTSVALLRNCRGYTKQPANSPRNIQPVPAFAPCKPGFLSLPKKWKSRSTKVNISVSFGPSLTGIPGFEATIFLL